MQGFFFFFSLQFTVCYLGGDSFTTRLFPLLFPREHASYFSNKMWEVSFSTGEKKKQTKKNRIALLERQVPQRHRKKGRDSGIHQQESRRSFSTLPKKCIWHFLNIFLLDQFLLEALKKKAWPYKKEGEYFTARAFRAT